jgi:hypothetical protein
VRGWRGSCTYHDAGGGVESVRCSNTGFCAFLFALGRTVLWHEGDTVAAESTYGQVPCEIADIMNPMHTLASGDMRDGVAQDSVLVDIKQS